MPIENPYYTAAVHGDFQLADIGDVALADGATLRGCQLAYQTLGTLNAAKDNAVLIPTWYSGNHSVMRDTYVGAGRAIDPADHFVVLVNQIGSGLGTSPHNLEGAMGGHASRGSGSATTWWPRSGCCARSSASRSWPWSSVARWAPSRRTSGPSVSPTA